MSLELINEACGIDKHHRRLGKYRCHCGNVTKVAISKATSGHTRSCGCLIRGNRSDVRHGLSKTPTYTSWHSMKSRCTNEKFPAFKGYGGKGVSLHPRWMYFDKFLEDMGIRPDGTSLDRIDATRGYEPGNCRWATHEVQQRNKLQSVVWIIDGKEFGTMREAQRHFGVSWLAITRWVRGQHYKRTGITVPPRANCYTVPKYAKEDRNA